MRFDFCSPPRRFRRNTGHSGQTRAELLITLGLLIVAGIGAWTLYGDRFVEATKLIIEWLTGGGAKKI